MIDIAWLKKQIFFQDLTDRELELIAEKVTHVKYPLKTVIFSEGSPNRGFYFVHKGKVEISKITSDGWRQTLAVYPENHFFGELSVIENKLRHSTDAITLADSEILELTKEDFISFEAASYEMMYKIMKTIARAASSNLHVMNEKLMKLLISY
jgi:CRP/FNR family transcriptional regulator